MPSVNDSPAYIIKIIAIVIATDISNMDEVFGSQFFVFVISCGLKSGVSSIIFILTPPF
jgi:hypothetical protein